MKKLIAVISTCIISFYNMQAMIGDDKEQEVVSSEGESSKSVVVVDDSSLHRNYIQDVFEACLLLHDNIWNVRGENARYLGKASRDILKSLQDHMSVSYLGSDDRCALFITAIANARRCIYDLEAIFTKPDEWGPESNIHRCFSAPITCVDSATSTVVTSITPGAIVHHSSSFELDADAIDDNDENEGDANDYSQKQIIQPSSVEIAGGKTREKEKEKDEEEIDFSDPSFFMKAQQYADASVLGIAKIIHESPQNTAEWKECCKKLEARKQREEKEIRNRQSGNFVAMNRRLAQEHAQHLYFAYYDASMLEDDDDDDDEFSIVGICIPIIFNSNFAYNSKYMCKSKSERRERRRKKAAKYRPIWGE
ncbi:hypothetical protein FACS1894122_08960 [Alphaproteobacteria bacterium]|nr:hypothetical protein FACS1894122_08960 [Alphaproteobacteria bacterium]